MIRNFQRLNAILDVMPTVSVLCVGDIMLDEYVSGPVTRLSPEAPVPVVLKKDIKQVLGGVGNVAANLSALGCKTSVFYAVGKDNDARQIQDLLQKQGIAAHPRPISPITTKKQRIVSQKQQICRIDSEEPLTLTKQQEDKIIHQVASLMPQHNIVILSDYNKGFLSPRVTQGIIQEAKKQHKYVLVDPKGSNYEKYRGATLIKPNLGELKTALKSVCPELNSLDDALPSRPKDLERIEESANSLRKKLNIEKAVVTLGEHGMIGLSDKKLFHLPTMARSVSDVSGAGDTSLAILASAISVQASLEDAIDLANIGAGIVVSKEGTATLSHSELRENLNNLFHTETLALSSQRRTPCDYAISP